MFKFPSIIHSSTFRKENGMKNTIEKAKIYGVELDKLNYIPFISKNKHCYSIKISKKSFIKIMNEQIHIRDKKFMTFSCMQLFNQDQSCSESPFDLCNSSRKNQSNVNLKQSIDEDYKQMKISKSSFPRFKSVNQRSSNLGLVAYINDSKSIERDCTDVNFMNFVKEVNQKKLGKSKENKSFDINPNKNIRHSLDNFDKVLVSNIYI